VAENSDQRLFKIWPVTKWSVQSLSTRSRSYCL